MFKTKFGTAVWIRTVIQVLKETITPWSIKPRQHRKSTIKKWRSLWCFKVYRIEANKQQMSLTGQTCHHLTNRKDQYQSGIKSPSMIALYISRKFMNKRWKTNWIGLILGGSSSIKWTVARQASSIRDIFRKKTTQR